MNVTIIAELGSSHEGSFRKAVELIDAAAKAGADGIKLQLFRAETLDSRPKAQERLRPYEVPLHWLPELRAVACQRGLSFGVTPFAVDLVEPLRGLVDWVKIAAPDLTYDALLKAVASLRVPIILSTMMATTSEIDCACTLLRAATMQPMTLLAGISAYPAQGPQPLGRLSILRRAADHVGLSDHSLTSDAARLAVALGATWIERHLRLDDTSQDNPDHAVSSTPAHFAHVVEQVRKIEASLGQASFGPLPEEQAVYATCRRTDAKPLRG